MKNIADTDKSHRKVTSLHYLGLFTIQWSSNDFRGKKISYDMISSSLIRLGKLPDPSESSVLQNTALPHKAADQGIKKPPKI